MFKLQLESKWNIIVVYILNVESSIAYQIFSFNTHTLKKTVTAVKHKTSGHAQQKAHQDRIKTA